MRENPLYVSDDDRLVRELIAENPWATIVSATPAGLVASHYPVLLDDGPELALLMHVGRPDEEIHGFGSSEVLVSPRSSRRSDVQAPIRTLRSPSRCRARLTRNRARDSATTTAANWWRREPKR